MELDLNFSPLSVKLAADVPKACNTDCVSLGNNAYLLIPCQMDIDFLVVSDKVVTLTIRPQRAPVEG